MPKHDRLVLVFQRQRETDISTIGETLELLSKALNESKVLNHLRLVNLSLVEVDAEPKQPSD